MKNLKCIPIMYLFGILLLGGCYAENKDIKALENRATDIQSKNVALEKRIDEIETQMFDLRGRLTFLEMSQNPFETAIIHPSRREFQRIDTSSGFFLISCLDAKPFLQGYKVILKIGNPSSAIYNGFKIKAKWGRKFDYKKTSSGGPNYEDWKKSLREKETSYVNDLKPASWNRIELILSPAKSEELEHIELSLQTGVVSLLRER